MKNQIQQVIIGVLKEMGITDILPEVEISGDPKNGDYTTNVAMATFSNLKSQISNPKWKNPMDLALQVKEKLKAQMSNVKARRSDQNIKQKHQSVSAGIVQISVLQDIDHIEVAPPGFINIFVTEAKLSSHMAQVLKEKEGFGTVQPSAAESRNLPAGKAGLKADSSSKIMVEFTDPNPFKEFHIGHLYSNAVGESLCRLFESQGHTVRRVNYQGDVGMHVAKAIWGMMKLESSATNTTNPTNTTNSIKIADFSALEKQPLAKRAKVLGEAYAMGAQAFEADEKAAGEIKRLNALIFIAAQRT